MYEDDDERQPDPEKFISEYSRHTPPAPLSVYMIASPQTQETMTVVSLEQLIMLTQKLYDAVTEGFDDTAANMDIDAEHPAFQFFKAALRASYMRLYTSFNKLAAQIEGDTLMKTIDTQSATEEESTEESLADSSSENEQFTKLMQKVKKELEKNYESEVPGVKMPTKTINGKVYVEVDRLVKFFDAGYDIFTDSAAQNKEIRTQQLSIAFNLARMIVGFRKLREWVESNGDITETDIKDGVFK
jgi:hypothetical protein